jgi:flagellar protein FlaG
MDLQVARGTSIPIHYGVQSQEAGAGGAANPGSGAPGSMATAVIRSMKQLEFAEINGKKVTIGEEQLVRAIEHAIREISGPDTGLEVKIHEATGSVVMRVVNRETGELIREVPPERTLDIVYKMMEIAGLLFDEKV